MIAASKIKDVRALRRIFSGAMDRPDARAAFTSFGIVSVLIPNRLSVAGPSLPPSPAGNNLTFRMHVEWVEGRVYRYNIEANGVVIEEWEVDPCPPELRSLRDLAMGLSG